MAKIPVYLSSEQIPDKAMDTEVAAQPYTAQIRAEESMQGATAKLQFAGKEVSEIADRAARHREAVEFHRQNAKRVIDVSNAMTGAYTQIAQKRLDYEKDPNIWDAPARVDADLKDIHDKLSSAIVDPEAKAIFSRQYARVAALNGIQIQHDVKKRQDESMKADTIANVQTLIEQRVNAANPVEQKYYDDQIDAAINNGKQANILHPQEANNIKDKAKQGIVQTQVENAIMEDPLGTMKKLEKDYGNMGLDAGQAAQYRAKALGEVHRRQGVNAITVDQQFQAGTLDIPTLDGLRDSQAISLPVASHYRAAIEGKLKAKEVSDPVEFRQQMEAAYKGGVDEQGLNEKIRQGYILEKDAKNILNVNKRANREGFQFHDQYLTLIDKTFKTAMGHDARTDIFGDKNSEQKYNEGMAKVYDAIQNEKLSGRVLYDRAKQIIAPYMAGQALEEPAAPGKTPPNVGADQYHPNVIKDQGQGKPPIPADDPKNFTSSGRPITFENPNTKKRFRSDGKDWIEVK